jgi:hypothetical protein
MTYAVAATGSTVRNFPIGRGTNYRPTVLTVTHSTADNIVYTAEHFNASAVALGYTLPGTIDKVSGARYWQIDRPAAPANFTSGTIRLYYGYGSSDGVTDFPNLTVVKTVGAGTAWVDINGVATANGTGNILSGSFTTFSKFTLGNKLGGTNPLPVTWKSFNGELTSAGIFLRWVTAMEKNNDYFEVHRSGDGETFETLARIPSAVDGFSSTDVDYTFLDPNPLFGNNYYRIRQVDFDQAESFSSVIRVLNTRAYRFSIQIYPNPAVHVPVTVKVSGAPAYPVRIAVYDLTGRLLSEQLLTEDELKEPITLSVQNKLAKGVYLIRANVGDMSDKKILIVE